MTIEYGNVLFDRFYTQPWIHQILITIRLVAICDNKLVCRRSIVLHNFSLLCHGDVQSNLQSNVRFHSFNNNNKKSKSDELPGILIRNPRGWIRLAFGFGMEYASLMHTENNAHWTTINTAIFPKDLADIVGWAMIHAYTVYLANFPLFDTFNNNTISRVLYT